MATSKIILFFAVVLCAGSTQAESFKSKHFESHLKPSRSFGASSVTINGQCDALSCAPDSTGSVEYKYGASGRGGKFEVVYKDDGSIEFNTEPTGSAKLLKTVIAVGSATECEFEAAKVPLTFDQCGFSHFTDGKSIGRTVLVKVRHQFASGVEGVHFFGGKDITVKIVLTKKDPETLLLATPVVTKDEEIDQCSALNHKITALNSTAANLLTFEVKPENYSPSQMGVGFDLQSCVLKPFLKNSNNLSSNPKHWREFIKAGVYIAGGSSLVEEEVVAGQYYKVVMRRLSLAFDVEDLDLVNIQRAPTLFCSVCFCSLPEGKVTKDETLRPCPQGIRVRDSISASRDDLSDFDEIDSGLVAGDVHVVRQPSFPF